MERLLLFLLRATDGSLCPMGAADVVLKKKSHQFHNFFFSVCLYEVKHIMETLPELWQITTQAVQ